MRNLSPGSLIAKARSPEGKKAIRYTLTSVVSVACSQVILAICYSGFHIAAGWSNVIAVSLSAIPSYELNRKWAWGKRGKSHLLKEVVPFWGLAFLGLVFSTWSVDWAESAFHGSALAVNAANLGSFGILWVAKFVIFNELLFKHHPEQLEDAPALDGRTGLPT